jgi:hypothetical protein
MKELPQESFLSPAFIEGSLIRLLAPREADINEHVIRLQKDTKEFKVYNGVELVDQAVATMGSKTKITSKTDLMDIQRKLNMMADYESNMYAGLFFNAIDHESACRMDGTDDLLRDIMDIDCNMKSNTTHYIQPNEIWMSPENKRKLIDQLFSITVGNIEGNISKIIKAINEIMNGYDRVLGLKIQCSPSVPDNRIFLLSTSTPAIEQYYTVDQDHTKSGVLHVKVEDNEIEVWRNICLYNRNPQYVGVIDL